MKHNIYIILFLLLAFCNYGYAAAEKDSTRVYFRDGSSVLELSIYNNEEILDSLISRYKILSSNNANRLISITVEGNASPSGTAAINSRLAKERAVNVARYLKTRIGLPDSLINIIPKGIDWESLAYKVENDSTIADGLKAKTVEILIHTPVWIYDSAGRIVDGRKKQLMELDRGNVYRMLSKTHFDGLHNSSIEIEYQKQQPKEFAAIPKVQNRATTEAEQTADSETSVIPFTGFRGDDIYNKLPPPTTPFHRLALKTNLLYDAALMPSLEVEYRISNRWTINLEGDVAWWKNDSRHKYYQLATISPEGRYWFKTRKPWHGHYVGVFAGFSWYDLENGARGYKGEQFMTGVSYGYMFPISRSLSFEAGIGAGFMHSWYEEYLPVDQCYVYQQSSRINYFGPLKLKFAFVWRIWDINKKKGGRR